ncbi:hypothetical protein [Streptomyces calvus]|uniref:hypothetical protein n=1 Tax=Streptomyces calvus TaxID=67282 RepID=UPI0037165E40
MQVPTTEVTLAPAKTTKVNLPTRAWLDKATFKAIAGTSAPVTNGVIIHANITAREVQDYRSSFSDTQAGYLNR